MYKDEAEIPRCDYCDTDLRRAGSHYHCVRCGTRTGMMGHSRSTGCPAPDDARAPFTVGKMAAMEVEARAREVLGDDAYERAELRQRPGDQNLPVTTAENQGVCVQDTVISDIERRKQVGIERYGSVLRPFNGRSALRDAYEESVDQTMYLKQMLLEGEAAENQQQVATWSRETFGEATMSRTAWRAWEEMKEFKEWLDEASIHPSMWLHPAEVESLAMEAADIVITLYSFAENVGRDLMADVRTKMGVNRRRTWTLAGDGTGYHTHEPDQAEDDDHFYNDLEPELDQVA